MKKNVASQFIGVQMITAADGTDFTGSITCTIAKDGAALGASGGTGPTHQATGYYEYAPTQAETNADHIAFHFTGTGAISTTVQVYTGFPQTVDNNVLAAGATGFAAIDTVVDTINTNVGTAGAGLTDITLNAASIDLVWDEVLTGATHNVTNSAGKRLRQIDAGFEVHSGTADAGGASTIDFETGVASTVDDIYNGDRVVITAGTGAGEHGLVLDYVGSTQQATMSKAWVITPDATSEYIVLPADCDVELWNDNAVTGDGDWAAAQTDLDTLTGADGATLATTQGNYAPAKAGDNMGTVSSVTGNVDGSTASVTGAVGSVTGAVGSVAGNVDGNVTGSVASNLELGPAEVNAEVVDVLFTDTDAEPAQGTPGATISLADKIGFLYKAWRNKSTQSATTYTLFNDDTTTTDHIATVSDNGTTATKGEVATGA